MFPPQPLGPASAAPYLAQPTSTLALLTSILAPEAGWLRPLCPRLRSPSDSEQSWSPSAARGVRSQLPLQPLGSQEFRSLIPQICIALPPSSRSLIRRHFLVKSHPDLL